MTALSDITSADLAARLSAARQEWEFACAVDRASSTPDTRRQKREAWEALCDLTDEDNRRAFANDFPL